MPSLYAIRPVCCRSLRGSPLNKPPSGECLYWVPAFFAFYGNEHVVELLFRVYVSPSRSRIREESDLGSIRYIVLAATPRYAIFYCSKNLNPWQGTCGYAMSKHPCFSWVIFTTIRFIHVPREMTCFNRSTVFERERSRLSSLKLQSETELRQSVSPRV